MIVLDGLIISYDIHEFVLFCKLFLLLVGTSMRNQNIVLLAKYKWSNHISIL